MHLSGISAFYIVEIKNYGAYLDQEYWDWQKSRKPGEIVTYLTDNNEKEEEPFDEIEQEFKKIIGLKSVKDDVRKFQQHLKIILLIKHLIYLH